MREKIDFYFYMGSELGVEIEDFEQDFQEFGKFVREK